MATTFEIHPAVGIARVGPSEELFLGPEPGVPPPESYRDGNGDLLRQAARFRVFRCERDDLGSLIEATQVTEAVGRLRWTVHLVNRKGAAPRFPPPTDRPLAEWPLRNPSVENRSDLVIDPGPRSLEGPNCGAALDQGTFLGRPIHLGDVRTDGEGNLLVLGGHGLSQSVTPDGSRAPLLHFANNDFWCDDVSDGSVRAEVTLPSGETVAALAAWAIVGPPDFAPPITNLVTLYDVAYQAAVDRGRLAVPSPPSFTRHIYPVLSRAVGYAWVSRFGHDGHGPRRPGDFAAQWSELSDPEGRRLDRKRIVDRLRDPNQPPPVSMPERSMPRLHDETNSSRVLPPTRAQYAMLLDWVAGNFVNDWQADLPEEPVPEALTRYALESCSGGAFFPGIEAGRIMKDGAIYAQPFRIDRAAVDPGGLTAGNAVPWQADFAACEFEDHARIGWWPAQRPDEVFTEPELGPPSEWADGAETFDTMAANWHRLGVVRGHVRGDGTTVFLEQERSLPRPE